MVNGGGTFDSLGRVRVGAVVDGSLTGGLEVRLDPETSIEDIKVGAFVTMQGERQRYFGVVTDIELGSTDDSLRLNPPGLSDPLAARVFAGTAAYGAIMVEPMLTVGADAEDGPQPAKTIPPHFSEVALASEQDIQDVFGEEGPGHFWIGNPLDMETRLCLNVAELVKRSNGVFGKSGTGKTFLTRLLLMGILQSGQATNLVFDMQSEYGWMGYSEANRQVKGLKQLFESRVAVFSLDEESSRRRGLSPDYVVRVGFDEVEADDVLMLRESLNLSEVAADASFELERRLGKNWLKKFLDYPGGEEFGELATSLNINQAALSALRRRLRPAWSGSDSWTTAPATTPSTASSTTWAGACTWCWSSAATATTSPPTYWSPTSSPGASTTATRSSPSAPAATTPRSPRRSWSPSRRRTSS